LTRYALIDHFFAGRTSAVGTYHSPVSPRKVVVAGRVSLVVAGAGGGAALDGVWADAGIARDPKNRTPSSSCRIVIHLNIDNGRA
jgi:hypothetical protein